MSAPFGYPIDSHWFYFRPVFFPLAFLAVSVYLPEWKSKAFLENWIIAATALLFSSMQMLYHFKLIAGIKNLMRFAMLDRS